MHSARPPRKVVDTSVIVRGLLSASGSPFQILLRWLSKELQLVASREIESEYRLLATRIHRNPKLEPKGMEPDVFFIGFAGIGDLG